MVGTALSENTSEVVASNVSSDKKRDSKERALNYYQKVSQKSLVGKPA